ncbi:MAG: hypothetical protein H6716_26630 [Polyangiaceae bacterium]|nr:hypothetical protein [Polyangiaceae bacterium]
MSAFDPQPRGSAPATGRAGDSTSHSTPLRTDVRALSYAEGVALRSPTGTAVSSAVQRLEGESPYGAQAARERAHIALVDSGKAVAVYARAIAKWQSVGWRNFLRATGGNGFIALTQPEWRSLFLGPLAPPSNLGALPAAGGLPTVVDAAGNAALAQGLAGAGSAAVKSASVSAAKASGAVLGATMAAFSGAGLPGFALGVLVNVLWSAISDLFFGAENAERAATRAAERATDQAFLISDAIRAGSDDVIDAWTIRADAFAAFIHSPASGAPELDRLARWLVKNGAALAPPALDPDALSQTLKRHWILQHSADATEPSSDTLPTAYRQVKRSLKMKAGDGGRTTRDLFIHQAKYAWGRLGLAIDGPIGRLQAWATSVADLAPEDAATRLSGRTVRLTEVLFPEVFAATLPARGGAPPALGGYEQPAAAAREGGFELACALDLEEDDGKVCVDRFRYRLIPKDGANADEEFQTRHGAPACIAPRVWETSPD